MQVKFLSNGGNTERASLFAVLGVLVVTSGCSEIADGADGRDTNLARGGLLADITSDLDISAPSRMTGLQQGTATYVGVAEANFGDFEATADATLTADFSSQTIGGSLTAWEDTDPLNYSLVGEVTLSPGPIAPDGRFATAVAGFIERNPMGAEDPLNPLEFRSLVGVASGQFYDSVDGAEASHVIGQFGEDIDEDGNVTGTFSGGFAARR